MYIYIYIYIYIYVCVYVSISGSVPWSSLKCFSMKYGATLTLIASFDLVRFDDNNRCFVHRLDFLPTLIVWRCC